MINTADELSASSSSSSSLESKDYWVKKCLDLAAAKNAAEARIEQLKQRNVELELENRQIRESKVRMQVRVEQEEEYISNMLLKRIQKLKTDKEQLAQKYEQEEEFLINDLMRKLTQLEGERDELANRLSTDQSWVVANLLQKIRKLEAEIQNNHKSLEQLRREKVDLENSLEHEQEALFNTLGKRMDSLEAEKRRLQGRLDDLEGPAARLWRRRPLAVQMEMPNLCNKKKAGGRIDCRRHIFLHTRKNFSAIFVSYTTQI